MYYVNRVCAQEGPAEAASAGWDAGVAKTTGGPQDVLTGSIKWRL